MADRGEVIQKLAEGLSALHVVQQSLRWDPRPPKHRSPT
jgi:hypothetical protein